MENWQIQLREGFRNVRALLDFLNLSADIASMIEDSEFPLRVPFSFAQRMKKGDRQDPLLLQILPLKEENNLNPLFQFDAVGDLKALKTKGLIQKYHGRVLIIMTGACAVHCRYCFRRHFPYDEQILSESNKKNLLSLLSKDQSVEEVIFSGGDPLLLTNSNLAEWAKDLLAIPHIKRWRIHTRLPSVLPARIDPGLLDSLRIFNEQDRQTVIVTHINHPNEIDTEVKNKLKDLCRAGITVLNQSVLLKGINDSAHTLKQLSEKLFTAEVLPYYLHLLDRAQGTQHFEVNEDAVAPIYRELSSQLPGYLVPKLVREIEGQPHKVIYGHSY
ncbi:MAG: hypothetical protein RJB66_1065 [Pseudomonadota bacterium]|jgi:EF-P beta-lysylation protein EpmB